MTGAVAFSRGPLPSIIGQQEGRQANTFSNLAFTFFSGMPVPSTGQTQQEAVGKGAGCCKYAQDNLPGQRGRNKKKQRFTLLGSLGGEGKLPHVYMSLKVDMIINKLIVKK